MKKIFALILALTLALSLSAIAFAEGPQNVTITAPANTQTHTYRVYQLFTGDYFEDETEKLSNVKYGADANLPTGKSVGNAVDASVINAIAALNGTDASNAEAISKYVVMDETSFSTLTSGQSISVPTGYYVIKDLGVAELDEEEKPTGKYILPEGETYSLNIIQVLGDVTMQAKASGVTVDKEILDTAPTKTNEASIGEVVNYSITGTLPSNLDLFDAYYYEFSDTLTKGLTYQKNAKVWAVNGESKTEVTSSFDIDPENATEGSTITDPADNTSISIKCNDVKKISGVTAETKFVVEYSAKVNTNAVIAGDGNLNTVKVKFNNNPNKDGSGKPNGGPNAPMGETPDSKVVTYVTEITILKHDENGNVLTGAEFSLTGNGVKVMVVKTEKFVEDTTDAATYWKLKDGTYTTTKPATAEDENYESTTTKYKLDTTVEVKGEGQTATDVKAFVGADGKITFTGLGAGEYTITETTTPAGYNTIEPIVFNLTFEPATTTDPETKPIFKSDNKNVIVGEDNKIDTTIVNQSGAVLPETGGIGTTIFYVVGAVLVAGAAIVLFAKKRVQD